MLKFLGSIILFVFFSLFFLFMLVVGFIKSLFYSSRNQTRKEYEEHYNPPTSSKLQNKVFEDNEGEYVDFEEVD